MILQIKNLFFLLLLLSIVSCTNLRNFNDISDERYDISKRAVEQLERKTKWVIENGLSVYYEKNLNQLTYEIEKDHYVGVRGKNPIISSADFIARFLLESSGIMYDTIIYNRKNNDGIIYEYWVVEINCADWAYVKRNVYFIITATDSIGGKRKIIKAETNFFETYIENGKELIEFPVNDDFSMYMLTAYYFPNNFIGYDYRNYRYIAKDNKTYKRIKLWSWQINENIKKANLGYFSKEVPFDGIE